MIYTVCVYCDVCTETEEKVGLNISEHELYLAVFKLVIIIDYKSVVKMQSRLIVCVV
jgi:hypothetical protein